MEKVSAKEFFSVLFRGVCQALGWFLSLFGFRRQGKFAKCVWGLFATSAAVILGLIAIIGVYSMGEDVCNWYKRQHYNCYNPYCGASESLSQDIYFHEHEDGKGYIFNKRTGEKLINHVSWIAEPNGKDSLICYSNGKKRGYFNKNTGKIVVEPKYDHAWIFSEGLASVAEDGKIKFIDETGNVVIDNGMAYNPNRDGYVFHGGYCVVATDDGELYGMIDRTGKTVVAQECNFIRPTDDYELWEVRKGKEEAVLDKELKVVVPFMECSIYIDEGTIDATMADHTLRKYNLDGSLIHDFYITSVRMLEYQKDEILYRTRTHDDDGDEYDEPYAEEYHPKANARLRAYVAGDGYEGLMTADGHIVTMPLYKDIEAIGYDLYLCTFTNYDKVIVNGKGDTVK